MQLSVRTKSLCPCKAIQWNPSVNISVSSPHVSAGGWKHMFQPSDLLCPVLFPSHWARWLFGGQRAQRGRWECFYSRYCWWSGHSPHPRSDRWALHVRPRPNPDTQHRPSLIHHITYRHDRGSLIHTYQRMSKAILQRGGQYWLSIIFTHWLLMVI